MATVSYFMTTFVTSDDGRLIGDVILDGDVIIRYEDMGVYYGVGWRMASGYPLGTDPLELWPFARKAAHILWAAGLGEPNVLRILIGDTFYEVKRRDESGQ